jgi:hypothetical protein
VVQVVGLVPGLAPEPSQGSQVRAAGNGDLDLGAGIGLLEGDLQVVAQVLAARGPRWAAAPPPNMSPKTSPNTSLKMSWMSWNWGAAAVHAVDAGVAEAVVGRALLRIGEDRIGLVDFLEPARPLGRSRRCGRDGAPWPSLRKAAFSPASALSLPPPP